MKLLSPSTPCPCCEGPMRAAGLACDRCQVEVRGPMETNEFASLSADDLHLLRIFLWAEGRVRDMESPLGLTYPTIRARLSSLRQRLQLGAASPPRAEEAQPLDPVTKALEDLHDGKLDFDQALASIRQRKKGKKT